MPATEAELRELYERYAFVIHHRARGILGTDEDAADAVQETFARVILHWDTFRRQSSPLTWMVQISTNYCLNRLRDRRAHARKHDHRKADIVGDGITRSDAHGRIDASRLRALLVDEDEETQRIILYLYFDDLTREDAARMVGISVPTLRKRHDLFLKRARRALRLAAPPLAALAVLTLLSIQVQG